MNNLEEKPKLDYSESSAFREVNGELRLNMEALSKGGDDPNEDTKNTE